MYTVLIADHLNEAGLEILAQASDVRVMGPFSNRDELLSALREVNFMKDASESALIVRSTTRVDGEILSQSPGLKVIARAGAQLENIDIDLATRQGIMVIHAPDTNIIAVVEHTFAMLLALARRLPEADRRIRQGEWPRHSMLGFQLFDKTIGIVGFGQQGQEIARRATAFGMKVLSYDPYKELTFARAQDVEMVDFNELLARADVITLHTSHTPESHHMINKETISRMKPGSCLVNCAHPGLVDETALSLALKNGQLAGAAIDSFSIEPPPENHPLFSAVNTVLAPHLNQNTFESQAATSRQVVEDVLSALRGEDYRHVANLPFHEGSLERRPLLYRQAKPYITLATRLGKLQGQLAEGWINRIEVEILGEGLQDLIHPVTASLLAGMLRPVNDRPVNWISAPVIAYEQGIILTQSKDLVQLADYPNLIACRIFWGVEGSVNGHRTIAGALFGNGGPRLVQYDQFQVDALPEGYVLVLENLDVPGVIGKVGTRLGQAGINIAQWRYGRESLGLNGQNFAFARAVSFINLDSRPSNSLLADLEREPEITRARLVNL